MNAPLSTRSSPTGCGRISASDPSTTLHDLRWGEPYRDADLDAYVWVFEISGAAPAVSLCRWLRRSEQRKATADVFSPSAAGRLKGLVNPVKSFGAASLCKVVVFTPTSDALPWSNYPKPKTQRPPARDDPTVADHARRDSRGFTRPDDGGGIRPTTFKSPMDPTPKPPRERSSSRRRRSPNSA